MWNIISFFNHKGWVWKTTLVHNLAFALADNGMKVLLIDADPQMNLTSAMYGLSTSIEYSTDIHSLWSKNIQRYISISEHLREYLEDISCHKEKFTQKSKNLNGKIDLISGDINLTNIEADLYGIIKNRNNFTQDIPYKFEKSITDFRADYDFILIDTSPSASSIINALLVISSDYFIAPVAPSFFSLQAIDNLSTIFQNWIQLLQEYRTTQWFRKGLSFDVKFLWLVVQLAKRFKGYSSATNAWVKDVNESAKKFQNYAATIDKSITHQEFIQIFWNESSPFIIEKCCDFTPKLRSIAEKEGVPVIYLTQSICTKHDPTVDVTTEEGQYTKSLYSINTAYRKIAQSLMNL